MDVRKTGKGWAWCAFAATTLVSLTSSARAGEGRRNVRILDVVQRAAVTRAVDKAARLLRVPECQALLDEFADGAGRPLRAVLEESGLEASEYLETVIYYAAPANLCRTSSLVVTTRGSHVVFICGTRFARALADNARWAEAAIIHEMLHSLGLGENPPSSDEITLRVLTRCFGSARPKRADPERRDAAAPSPAPPRGNGRTARP